MPDSPNSSFIPKRGPAPSRRGTPTKRLYLFSFISYVVLFASLVAAGGMYIYTIYLERQLDQEIIALNAEISSFSIANMQKFLEFDNRLTQASARLNSSVSVVSIFQALEAATIDTVMIQNLQLERKGDEKYLLTAAVQTDSFDSTIFQRSKYQQDQTISAIEIEGVQASVGQSSEKEGSASRSLLSFTASLEVPISSIPSQPRASSVAPLTITPPPAVVVEEVAGGESSTTKPTVNVNTI
jgi:hypothetical protein